MLEEEEEASATALPPSVRRSVVNRDDFLVVGFRLTFSLSRRTGSGDDLTFPTTLFPDDCCPMDFLLWSRDAEYGTFCDGGASADGFLIDDERSPRGR